MSVVCGPPRLRVSHERGEVSFERGEVERPERRGVVEGAVRVGGARAVVGVGERRRGGPRGAGRGVVVVPAQRGEVQALGVAPVQVALVKANFETGFSLHTRPEG
jgi:hypothetical protein